MSSLRYFKAFGTAAVLAFAYSASAEPTSGPVTISQLRPYIGGNTVYVYLSGTGPCGSGVTGANAVYTIDVSTPSGKAAYAAALTAMTMGKQVLLEVQATVCGTPYPGLQSVYVGG